MAEQNNEPQTAIEIDEYNKKAAIEARLSELKAEKSAETNVNNNTNNTADNSSPEEIENNLGEQKGIENKKNGVTEQLADIGAKQLKKRLGLWVLSVVGGFILSTAWIWLPLIMILFLVGIPYYYWTKHPWDLSLYWNVFTGNYEQLFMDAINDNPSPTYQTTLTPITTDTAKPATPAANVTPDTTAQ